MPGKAPVYYPVNNPNTQGKTKMEIADEAFAKLGPLATKKQVDDYFRKQYNLSKCEISMYWTARGAAKRKAGLPAMTRDDKLPASIVPAMAVAIAKADGDVQLPSPAALVQRTKQLASDLGGYDKLLELVEALTGQQIAAMRKSLTLN